LGLLQFKYPLQAALYATVTPIYRYPLTFIYQLRVYLSDAAQTLRCSQVHSRGKRYQSFTNSDKSLTINQRWILQYNTNKKALLQVECLDKPYVDSCKLLEHFFVLHVSATLRVRSEIAVRPIDTKRIDQIVVRIPEGLFRLRVFTKRSTDLHSNITG
jgi:hypothetical protein